MKNNKQSITSVIISVNHIIKRDTSMLQGVTFNQEIKIPTHWKASTYWYSHLQFLKIGTLI